MSGDSVERVRAREYPTPPEGVFFNSASWGLIPLSSAEASSDLSMRRNRSHGFEERELGAAQRRCRGAVATLLDASANEIALVPNTSFGMSLAAALVSREAPGVIVVSAGEFPANVLPWRALDRLGFTVTVVPCGEDDLPDEDALVRAVQAPDVRALSVSSVQFASGYRADLTRLGDACQQRGVLFCVDAIQGLGASSLRPREVNADIVAAGGQKWLCAPWGSGFAWIRQELHERFDPWVISWLAMEGSADFVDMLGYGLDWRANARKFEPATLGTQDYLGLARSVEVLLELGVETIREHIFGVQEPLIEWVRSREDATLWTPADRDRRAGIISVVPPDIASAVSALRKERVVFSVREGAIRFSPHFYNTEQEMRLVVDILDGASA